MTTTSATPDAETPQPSKEASPRRGAEYTLLLLVITGVGALLRFVLLGHQPLWRDEAFTALAVHRSVGSMLHVVGHDSAPPLSYLLQHPIASVWSGAGGLRAVSALAGTAAIPLGAALGRRVGGDRLGLWSAAVVAAMPSLVLESRDARMYALATTLVLASTLALWRFVERPTWSRALVYALCTAAALATNYFAAMATIAQLAAAIALLRPPRWARNLMLVAAALGAAPLVPWLVYARSQFAHGSSPFWVGGVGFSTISGVLVQLLGGPSIDAGVPGAAALVAVQAVVVAIGLAGFAVLALRRRSRPAIVRRGERFLLACGLGAMALLVVVSVWHPLVEARYASVLWGPLVVLLAAGLAEIPWRGVAAGAVGGLAAGSVVLSFALTQPDTPTLARRVNGHLATGDLVSTSPAGYLLLRSYGDAATRRQTRIVARDVPWYWGVAVFPSGAVLRAYPASPGPGTIFYVDVPGQPRAIVPPAPYRAVGDRRCYSTICLTVYRPVVAAAATQPPGG